MKQVAARLEDEFVKKLKQYSLDNDISMQEIIKQALTSYIANKLTTPQVNNITSVNVNKLASYDDSDPTEEDLEEARATTIYVDEAPIPVYIEETPIITTYDNSPLSLDDLVPNKPKPKERVSKYR